ncbi:MAG: 50S ribosomal protein L25/general stress protein Ctc [Hyphomonadaceae bacterium]|nr:50S ribosomal protein L25/general stress protein Ctc [Hyphomonadaceae bacterium]
MTYICLEVAVRENTGTGLARAARRDGEVPGILYGGGQNPVAIALRRNEVLRAINSGRFLANMIEISHEGKKQKVITKEVQFHPVNDMPVHIDLYRVKETTVIEVEISVNFVGDDSAPGIKRGGILNVVRYAVEVKCPAGSIPDTIEADVSHMDIGDSLHISDVTLPEGVTPAISDRDFTIATIVSSRVSRGAGTVEDGEESTAVDGKGEGAEA